MVDNTKLHLFSPLVKPIKTNKGRFVGDGLDYCNRSVDTMSVIGINGQLSYSRCLNHGRDEAATHDKF